MSNPNTSLYCPTPGSASWHLETVVGADRPSEHRRRDPLIPNGLGLDTYTVDHRRPGVSMPLMER
jgi:hypothetical protein